MAEKPWGAKLRISSRHSHGFFSRLSRSTFCALVSACCAASTLIGSFQSKLARKSKRPIAALAMGLFLNFNYECVLGNSAICQRHEGLTTTNTHVLAN